MFFATIQSQIKNKISENNNLHCLVLRILLLLSILGSSLFGFFLYNPENYPKSCEGTSLSKWATSEFYFLIFESILTFSDILLILYEKKRYDGYSVSSQIDKMQIGVFGFLILIQFILWIGLCASYRQTQEECGYLKILVYYFVVGGSVIIGLILLFICFFMVYDYIMEFFATVWLLNVMVSLIILLVEGLKSLFKRK